MKLSVGQRVKLRHDVENCDEPAYVKAGEIGEVIAVTPDKFPTESHIVAFRFGDVNSLANGGELRYLILDAADVAKCVDLPN